MKKLDAKKASSGCLIKPPAAISLRSFIRPAERLLVAVFVLSVCVHAAAQSGSQTKLFSVDIADKPIGEALEEIGRISGYSFFYYDTLFGPSDRVTLKTVDLDIEATLEKLFSGTDKTYSIDGKQVYILYSTPGNDQPESYGQVDIRGMVVDTNDPPSALQGVYVGIKGARTLAITDVSGFFAVKVRRGDILVFSMAGYKNYEYRVTESRANVSIALESDINILDQVIVTGMTSQQRKHVASSVGVVTTSNFENKPVTKLSQALQGGTTGIVVSQGSGTPGDDNATIRIRGVASLLGSNPLVLVDGFEFDLNKLDPSTVESVSILKDAAAASIYGAKAGNGVILITTKRGTAGTVKVGYNGYVGVQKPMYMSEFASAPEYMRYVNEALRNTTGVEKYSLREIELTASGEDPINYPDTNWRDLLFKYSTVIHEHNISVSGGNTTGRFALSAQYLNQEGLYKIQDNGFQRLTVRANTSVNLTKNIMIFVDTFVGRDTQKIPDTSLFGAMHTTPPVIVGKYPAKEGSKYDFYGVFTQSAMNPLAMLENETQRTSIRDYVTINARPTWRIMPGLELRGQVGYRLSTGMDKTNRDPYVYFDYFTDAELTSLGAVKTVSYTTRANYWSAGATLDWHKQYGGHRVNLLGGWSQELDARTGWDNVSLVSYFGKVYYSFKDRYLFEAGVRYDGSSLFSKGHKWGSFPSVAMGWNISRENWIQPAKFISNLKLRISYGMLGNNNIAPYSYQTLIAAGSGTETKNGNLDIRWETVAILNAGIDLGLFGDKLEFTFDCFRKVVNDLIMTLPPTPSSGLLSFPNNVGKAEVKGIEVGFAYNQAITKNLGINLSLGYSYNRSEWLHIPGGEFISSGTIHREGGPLRASYAYLADTKLLSQEDLDNRVPIVGGYPDSGITMQMPGDIRYIDTNGDGIINENDKVSVGDVEPHQTYYGNLTLTYKNIDFDMQIIGVGDYNGFYGGAQAEPLSSALDGNVLKWQLDYWSQDNPNPYASRPRVTGPGTANSYGSTFWMFPRSFARIKYIQIGYSFKALSRKIHANHIRVYFNAQNPFTFTKSSVLNPETSGSTGSTYPMFQTYSLGLNLSF